VGNAETFTSHIGGDIDSTVLSRDNGIVEFFLVDRNDLYPRIGLKRSDGKGGFDNNAEIDLAPHHRIKRDLSGLQVREAGVESVFFEDTFVLGDNEEHGDIFPIRNRLMMDTSRLVDGVPN